METKSKSSLFNFFPFNRNPGVRTVEEELEKVLFKHGLISPCNYGVLQKISWSRASRTDKKVSAAMNLVSCKLHYYEGKPMQEIIENLNKDLDIHEIKIISLIEVSGSFDAKECSNNREYHYILPAFCLQPKLLEEENKKKEGEAYSPYTFKISPEFKEKIQKFCSVFRGTKRYHNYTRKLTFNSSEAQRVIYEVTCNELFEVNGVQYIKFKLVGQSFLYNQIRKMIGMIIDVIRENKTIESFEESFTNKIIITPKAPAEGLYLYKIDYSKYNTKKTQKKNNIEVKEEDQKRIDEFSESLKQKVHESEAVEKVFSKWLVKFDNKEFDDIDLK